MRYKNPNKQKDRIEELLEILKEKGHISDADVFKIKSFDKINKKC